MTQPVVTAVIALALTGTLLWLGRHDLTRPAVAFGAPWFGFVALAQLRLTTMEGSWSTDFTLLVLGGGLAFVAAAVVAGGTAPSRGTVTVDRSEVQERRLVLAAMVLLAGGAIGLAYKTSVLGDVPLLADEPDVVRGRAVQKGEPQLAPWSSALTNGFYLGMWCTLAALWVGRPRGWNARRGGLWLLALAALVAVSLEASRNVLLFALVVPAIVAYLVAPAGPRGVRAAWVVAAASVLAIGVGGLFVARLNRADSDARTFVEQELDRQPAAVRPLLPLYINAVFPLEAARRVHDAVPHQIPYALGANSLASLPAAFFPEGKPNFGGDVAGVMRTGGGKQLVWTVATYQGSLFGDLGWQGVLLGSLLLGLAFGSLQRWARARTGLLAVSLIAYLAYYSAYMLYDNLLSFTIIAVYDLIVIAIVGAYCTGRLDEPVRLLARAFREPTAS